MKCYNLTRLQWKVIMCCFQVNCHSGIKYNLKNSSQDKCSSKIILHSYILWNIQLHHWTHNVHEWCPTGITIRCCLLHWMNITTHSTYIVIYLIKSKHMIHSLHITTILEYIYKRLYKARPLFFAKVTWLQLQLKMMIWTLVMGYC